MLKFNKINFVNIITSKMKEDRAEYLTADEIIENGGEDTEFLLSMLPLSEVNTKNEYE